MNKMNIYEKMPVIFQNLIVSFYGLLRNHRRYGGSFKIIYKSIQNNECLDEESIRNYQKEALKKLLISASRSKHYSTIFEELKIDVFNDDPFIVLSKMPILTKNELRNHEKDFLTGSRRGDQVFHTSGSTGTPLNIVMGIDDFRLRMAILERIKKRFGISHKDKHITFVGKKITKKGDKCFWRNNIPGKQLVMSVYDLADKNKKAYLKKIISYNPVLIEGYPSAISVIAKWIIESDIKICPKAVFVTAETLMDEQKKIIEKAFNCPVVNYYGSTEGAPIISPCLIGNLHLDFESGIIEFLDNNYQTSKKDEISKMIVTCLTTNSMPLIRYDIGDLAIVSDNNCDCGSCMPIIKEIVGRQDDVFETPEKGFVGRLSTSLKLFPPVVTKSQIQQVAPTEFVLLIECERKLDDSELKIVVDDLVDKLGKVEIKVVYTDSIPLGKNGKFRSQIKLF